MDLKQKLNEFNIEISDNQLEKFDKYMQLLLKWNEKINLTAIIEPDEVKIKHFLDSLTVLKYINDEDKVIDIGSRFSRNSFENNEAGCKNNIIRLS